MAVGILSSAFHCYKQKPKLNIPSNAPSKPSIAGGLVHCTFVFFAGELSEYVTACSTYIKAYLAQKEAVHKMSDMTEHHT